MKSFFISSTFRDMQEERDVIHRIVFPFVRKELRKYGESAEEVDLRWGVDTLNLSEEESGHMVIRVCIDAIDRCVPYFIVLLGERYGWIPERNVFDEFKDERIERFSKDISITEMEIQYGTLEREIGVEKCIFCFRDSAFVSDIPEELCKDYAAESVLHKEKLDKLKARIREIQGANILDYEVSWDEKEQKVSGLDEFTEKLQNMLLDLLQREGLSEEVLSEEEKITKNAEFTMQQYLNTYVNRAKPEEMLPILYASRKSVWFFGPSGCGKTAFLSFAANQCRQKDMISRIYYGGDAGCQSVDTFLYWLVYELEKICGEKLREDTCTRRLTLRKIQSLSKKLTKNVMIFVDAVDQMSEDIVWVLTQLLKTTTKIQFFVTSTDNLWELGIKEAEDVFAMRKIDELTDTELELIVAKVAGRRGKSLDAKVTKRIREKKSMHLPVNLSLLLQRLFMMDGTEFVQAEKLAAGMEGISRYMQMLVDSAGDSSEELVEQVVNKVKDIMYSEGGENISRLLGIIAASPGGVSMRMLTELCPNTTTLQIQQLLCFMYDMLEETEDGRWVYRHPVYLRCIRQMIGETAMRTYEEALYEKYKEDRGFIFGEFINLGESLRRDDLAGEIADAITDREFTEEELWNLVQSEQGKDDYLISLVKTIDNEQYAKYILRGIFNGNIAWSEDVISLLKEIDDERFEDKETLFYLYGAKHGMYEILSQFDKEKEYEEKQYQIFTQIENVSREMLLEMVDVCVDGCCSYSVKQGREWYQRLSEAEKIFSEKYKDTHQYLLLNELLVWYWNFHNYKENGKEEDLEQLKKLIDAQHTIYKVQDNLNLYEQENPGLNEKCMKQLAIFARNLSGIYIKGKNFTSAYPYAKIAYDEAKKAYQLNRTFKTGDTYCWTATNLMRCMKKGTDARKKYCEEAFNVLSWMEKQYFCPRVGECQRYLYTLKVEEGNAVEMRKKALDISKRLIEEFPEGNYEEYVLYDYQKYKDTLREKYEHPHFDEIIVLMSEIEERAKKLYEITKDEYFLDILHGWALEVMQTYTWQEMYDEAEKYLKQAEEYLKCDYIQKSKIRWGREVLTAVNGIVLYYRKGDKEKLDSYIQKAEALFADEEEKNKNTSCKNTAILWSARIMHMRARIFWEETHDLEKTRAMADEYFEKYEGVVDKNEQRPMRFLLAELEATAGNAGRAIIEWKKVRMRGEENMGWKWEHLSEYEVWQYIMAAKASLLIYDTTKIKDSVYLNKGISAFTDILASHTRNQNAAYRKVAGIHLAEYFAKYKGAINADVARKAAKVILIWLDHIEKERELTQEENVLKGECIISEIEFNIQKPDEEDDKSGEWIINQKKEHSDDTGWNDRANRILMNKALGYSTKGDYKEALKVCESIADGDCEEWNREKDVLLCACKIQTGLEIENTEILENYILDVGEKHSVRTNKLWLYMESLIAVGKYYSEKEEEYFRKAAKILEDRVLDKKHGTNELWGRDYVLRTKCLEYSEKQEDKDLYLEDLKAARMAWGHSTGNDKESMIKLLEWDARIARAYEGVDKKFEWVYWEAVISIMRVYLLKKDLLEVQELEKAVLFYEMLLGKMDAAESLRYYTVAYMEEFAFEVFNNLYNRTKDTKWLEKALEAIETYRRHMDDPKLEDKRSDFRKEKIAESYEEDMKIYGRYLDDDMEEVVDRIVEAGRTWISAIPGYYKELVTKAIGFFKFLDEFLEGRYLEVKVLIQALQMRREGDSNEIFWFIKGLYGEHGTNLSLEQLQEMYRKEREEKGTK